MDRTTLKDNIWISVAKQIATLSKDENTKIGAVIVGADGRVLSTGYNGGAQGIADDRIPHGRELRKLQFYLNGELKTVESTKHPFMVHAERNAIECCPRPDELKGATIYVTAMPCPDCAWNIARRGISRVVVSEYKDDPNSMVGKDSELSLFMLAEGNVSVTIGGKAIGLLSTLNMENGRIKSRRKHG